MSTQATPLPMRWSPFLVALLILPVLAGCIDDAPVERSETVDAATVATSPYLPADVATHPDVAELLAGLANGTVTVQGEPAFLLGADPRNGFRTFDLELEPSGLVTNDTWVEIDGERQSIGPIAVYEGHVAGRPTDMASLTVTPDWARGTVRSEDVSYRIRINMEGNFPVGTELYDDHAAADNGRAAIPVPAPPTFDKFGVEPHDCLSLVPDTVKPTTDILGPSTEAPLTARIILDADALYAKSLGHHTFPMMVAMLAEVDAIYQHQTGLRFQIMGLHLHTNETAMPAPADEAPLGNLSTYWNARDDARDMVHLYTGYPSSYAQANCIGGAGMPDLAYTFTTIHWASEASGKMRHEQTYAHELGHILNAHHHYGNPVEGGVSTTIMHQGGEKVHPVFSTFSRSVIRGWAETHLGQHDHA